MFPHVFRYTNGPRMDCRQDSVEDETGPAAPISADSRSSAEDEERVARIAPLPATSSVEVGLNSWSLSSRLILLGCRRFPLGGRRMCLQNLGNIGGSIVTIPLVVALKTFRCSYSSAALVMGVKIFLLPMYYW